jgi:Zn-dependent M28 family amino/carboxypeptidase
VALGLVCTVSVASAAKTAVVTKPGDTKYPQSVVQWLADPAREGRGIGTAGIDSAAAYLARQMKGFGLTPGGENGGYFQPFEVTTGVAVGTPCGMTVNGRSFAEGKELEPLGFSTNGSLKAPVVFAGYGITAPGYDYDDYAGLDAHDKLVLVLTNEPGEMDSTSRFDGNVNTPHAELRTKAINAREHGALGLLVVDGPRYHKGEPLRKPRGEGAGYMSSGLLAAQISEEGAEALLKPAGLTLAQAQDAIDSHTRPHSLALPESAFVQVTLKRTRAQIKNVVGWFPGKDTTRTLVIGAHYDHLGFGGESSLDPNSHKPHVGADDNASGVGALLAIAGRIGQRRKAGGGWQPEHNLVFCAFTGEESGLLGSGHFVDDPVRPQESIETMLNMDMVGRLRQKKLMVMGVGTAAEFPTLVANVNESRAGGFDVHTSSDGYGPSDHSSFYKRQIPVLMLFTGAHSDYHKPSDTADKINAAGLDSVARFAQALVESLDARPRPTYVKAQADSTVGRIAGGAGYGAYLGTIPDYMQTEGGVKLSGVRAGGPAEQAGLKADDVIVKFDGIRVDNIYDYTYALRSRKPGQSVHITVLRAGSEVELVATLGRRP